jgi:SAM-dependent methyltransferase
MWDDPVLYDLENADDPAFDLPFWSGLVARLRPRRMLELACGTGRLTIPLAGLGIAEEIVGLDSSATFLERARSAAAAAHPAAVAAAAPNGSSADGTRISWVLGDMRSPPVEGPFDLVAIPFNSLAYVHGVVDRAAVLSAATSLLAPGGSFVVDVVAPRYDLLAEALHDSPAERVDTDHPAPELGVDRFTRRYVDRYDPSTQTLTSTNRYEIHWSSGEVEHRELSLDWHIAFPSELESELSAAGLRVVERFGGWNGEPWGPTARRIIWICERSA